MRIVGLGASELRFRDLSKDLQFSWFYKYVLSYQGFVAERLQSRTVPSALDCQAQGSGAKREAQHPLKPFTGGRLSASQSHYVVAAMFGTKIQDATILGAINAIS